MSFIEVGRVTGLHGVHGKIKVAPLSGDPSGLLAAKVVRVVGAGDPVPEREYEVVAAHRAGGCAVFSLRGVDSAEAAGALSGAAVSVRRDQLPALPDDEFYWADLVGCEVVDEGRWSPWSRDQRTTGWSCGGPGGRRGSSPWSRRSSGRSTWRGGGWWRRRRKGGDVRVDVLTLFPGMFPGPLSHSILARAREAGLLTVEAHDLRQYAEGKHRVTDEPPFGGGGGMVMKPEPIFAGVEALVGTYGPGRVILLSPSGALLAPETAARLAREEHLILICGRYEGVDQRVADHLADEEISIGDYVLSGGELPALVLIDAVARFLPGVLGDPDAPHKDSFSQGFLEAPHYTRPREFRGWPVPDVLLSGDHGAIEAWRREEGERRTASRRPELLRKKLTDR
jgi:tRNA (guanine37-N1)-methyltransferase